MEEEGEEEERLVGVRELCAALIRRELNLI